MQQTIEKLRGHASDAPSRWREEAMKRRENKVWLRYSQMIAMKMLDRMERLNLTQKEVAERMGCSQQYVSKVLRGKENLSLETLSRIEDALQIQLIYETEPVV
ncbi:MAG: helix-turn-helix transcriptional regulator [Bacteroidaceae bacterium]|nr:helix-turn-helix transcriptional regulator [Bacteroidaceae bacterium]